MATFQVGSSVILLFPRHSDIMTFWIKLMLRFQSTNYLTHSAHWILLNNENNTSICTPYVWCSLTRRHNNKTHPEWELDIVVMVSEHWLRSPVGDPALVTTDVETAEVSVAAVATLVVDVSQDGPLFLSVPHPGQTDPAGQQRVRRWSAQDKLGRAGNIEGYSSGPGDEARNTWSFLHKLYLDWQSSNLFESNQRISF